MATVSAHQHNFLPSTWPFELAETTLAYTSNQVIEDAAPIVLAFHDHDGEWQFLHGQVGEADECKIICMGCVYDLDPSIGILSDLPPGTMAYRDSKEGSWHSEPYANDESIEV